MNATLGATSVRFIDDKGAVGSRRTRTSTPFGGAIAGDHLANDILSVCRAFRAQKLSYYEWPHPMMALDNPEIMELITCLMQLVQSLASSGMISRSAFLHQPTDNALRWGSSAYASVCELHLYMK
jgi:hypothetical protein